MQLKPNATDSRTLLDLQKCRNSNELAIVLGRINEELRLNQSSFKARSELSKQYKILSWTLQATDELEVAKSLAISFPDSKRKRIVRAILTLYTDVRALRYKLLAAIDNKCNRMVSPEMDTYVNAIYDLFTPISNKIVEWHFFKDGVVSTVLSVLELETDNGYVIPKAYIKLDQVHKSKGVSISTPPSAYEESPTDTIVNKGFISAYLKASFNYTKLTTPSLSKSAIKKLVGIVSSRVSDEGFTIQLREGITDEHIHKIVAVLMPTIRRAYFVEEYEVLYSMKPDRSELSFYVAERVVKDPIFISKLARALNLTGIKTDKTRK